MPCQRVSLLEAGIGMRNHIFSLEGAVAHKKHLSLGQVIGKRIRADDMGLHVREPLPFRAVNGGIHLHPSRIDHRHYEIGPICYAVDQNVQRTHGNEGFSGAEGQALGRGDAHAEARVGTGAGTDGYGVAVCHFEAGLVQHFLHQRGGQGSLHARFRADAFCHNGPVTGERHGQDRSRCFDEEDAGHYSFLRRKSLMSAALRTWAVPSTLPSTMNHTIGRLPMP